MSTLSCNKALGEMKKVMKKYRNPGSFERMYRYDTPIDRYELIKSCSDMRDIDILSEKKI